MLVPLCRDTVSCRLNYYRPYYVYALAKLRLKSWPIMKCISGRLLLFLLYRADSMIVQSNQAKTVITWRRYIYNRSIYVKTNMFVSPRSLVMYSDWTCDIYFVFLFLLVKSLLYWHSILIRFKVRITLRWKYKQKSIITAVIASFYI